MKYILIALTLVSICNNAEAKEIDKTCAISVCEKFAKEDARKGDLKYETPKEVEAIQSEDSWFINLNSARIENKQGRHKYVHFRCVVPKEGEESLVSECSEELIKVVRAYSA